MASGWHRTDDDWVDHPKTVRLEELLNDPNAGMFVARLWAWTSRFRVRGRFADDVVKHLETMCRWRGEPGKLLSALLAAGWVDERSPGQYEVHDWWEKQGALVEKAEKDSERKRRSRARRDRGQSADGHADVPRDGAGTRRTDETRRDETRRDVVAPPPATPAPAPIGITITAPDTPREVWVAEDFWRWAQALRAQDGLVPEKPPRNLSTWWSAVMMTLNGDVDRACEAFEEFGQDPHWEARKFPFAAFQSQWEKYSPRRVG